MTERPITLLCQRWRSNKHKLPLYYSWNAMYVVDRDNCPVHCWLCGLHSDG